MSIIGKVFLGLLLLIGMTALSQVKSAYVLFDSRIQIETTPTAVGNVHEWVFSVPNKNDIDYFKFILNTDGDISFDNSAAEVELEGMKVMKLDELMKRSPCEIHEFFSYNQTRFVKNITGTNKYRMWLPMYLGTVKNSIVTKQKTKI